MHVVCVCLCIYHICPIIVTSTVVTEEGTWGRREEKRNRWDYESLGHFLHNIFLNTGPSNSHKELYCAYWMLGNFSLLHMLFFLNL